MTFASCVRRFTVAASTTLALLSAAGTAKADPEADAKDLFARARELRSANDCGGAVTLFRKAYAIYPQGLGSLRNVAECEEQLGHFASSRRAWLDIKRALITMPPDAKYDGWDKDAENAATRLKPKVATFVVDVIVKSPSGEAPANENSGVEVLVNGESVGTKLVGTPLERDPGRYLIRAQSPAGDAQPVETTVDLAAGDNPHVTLNLTRTPKEGGTIIEPPVTEHGSSTQRIVGYAVGGVGGALIVGGVITLILRQGALSDQESICGGSSSGCDASKQSDPSLSDAHDRGVTMNTLSWILLPVGVVAAGAGVALVLTSKPSSSEQAKTAPKVFVTPTLGGLTMAGTF